MRPAPDRHLAWRCPRCEFSYTSTFPITGCSHRCLSARQHSVELVPVPATDGHPSVGLADLPRVGQTGTSAAKAGRRDGTKSANDPGGNRQ